MSKITDFGEWKFERLQNLISEDIRKEPLGKLILTYSIWSNYINRVENEAKRKEDLQRKKQAQRRFTVRDKRGVVDND